MKSSRRFLTPWTRISIPWKFFPRNAVIKMLLTVFCALAPDGRAASFTGLGYLPGGDSSYAYGVSANGAVVVGNSFSTQQSEAFRWTQEGGMTGLGWLPGGKDSGARGVSGDGLVVVGWSSMLDTSKGEVTGWWAFQWAAGQGIQSLGVGTAQKANADGSVIVGMHGETSNAYRWVTGGGAVLAGVNSDDARDVSADGSVVVGTILSRAYRWTLGGGPIDLGALEGHTLSEAAGVSASGEFVVGVSYNGIPASQAFRWSQAEGMIGLGSLPDTTGSRAMASSGNGSVIVGYAPPVAFVWDITHGMRNLAELIKRDYGTDLSDWGLYEATAISTDGRTIVGNGYHNGVPEAWMAKVGDLTLPELAINTSGADITISWPGLKTSAWQVQSVAVLSGQWTNVDATQAYSNGQVRVTFPSLGSAMYYRLTQIRAN
jgi:probable HAF family extracellular repeat protein